MSSRRKTSLASVQRTEDFEVKSVMVDDGVYTECAEYEDEEGGVPVPSPEDAPPSPPLPMSPLTTEESNSDESEVGEDNMEENQDPEGQSQNQEFHGTEEIVENDIGNTSPMDEIDIKEEQEYGEEEEQKYDEEEQKYEEEQTAGDDELPGTPFTRNYSCTHCSFHTQNPRTHLYHLRDVHGAKGRIYGCQYCVYASNHSQKVNRHIDKCHMPPQEQPPIDESPPTQRMLPVKTVKREPFQFLKNLLLKEKEEKEAASNRRDRNSTSDEDGGSKYNGDNGQGIPEADSRGDEKGSSDGESEDGTGSESGSGTTEGSDEEVAEGNDNEEGVEEVEDEEEAEAEDDGQNPPQDSGQEEVKGGTKESRSGLFRCTLCTYSTRIKSRFTKHVRYHSMPLIKCIYCDFKTPYKWNLDRHYKSHMGDGSLRCPLCNFSADIKQSITVHIQNHHENLTPVRVLELVQSLDKGVDSSSLARPVHIAGIGATPRVPPSPKTARLPPTKSPNTSPPQDIVDKNGKKKFKCKYCAFSAIWESELNRHLRRTHLIATQVTPPEPAASTSTAKPRTKRVTSTNTSNRNNNIEASALCPNVVYSFGDNGRETKTLTKCEYCSDVFNSDEELLNHQHSCEGLAKIQEWNGGLLWNGNDGNEDTEMNDILTTTIKRSLDNNNMNSNENATTTTQKKVYKCPHSNCQFWAITASRFHVHMVGHSNSKPFECSLCSYKSNWRWDIAKHIKLKSMRDNEHLTARVILTDQSGERNYKEYDQYLMLMKVKHSGDLKLPDCSTKADKRTDIETEIAGDEYTDHVKTEMPDVEGNESPGVSPHNFLKPSYSAPRRFIKNNFLKDTGRSSNYSTQPRRSSTDGGNFQSVQIKTEDGSPPAKIFKAEEKPPVIWKCKKCAFRHIHKEAVFLHLRQSHNMQKKSSVSSFKNNTSNVKTESEVTRPGDVNLNGTIAGPASSSKESHQYIYNEDGGFSCKFCPFSTMKLDAMILHSDNHYSKAYCTFNCDYCSYSVASQGALDEHLLLHNNETDMSESEHKTPVPPGRISRFLKNQSPSTTSSPNKKYRCPDCPYVTDSRGQYHYHNQFHQSDRDSLYKCSECSYNVSHKHLLHQHVRVHQLALPAPEPPAREEPVASSSQTSQNTVSSTDSALDQIILCELCPARFFRVNQLQIHSVFHERQSLLLCSECSYSVRKPEHLALHLKVHTAEYQQQTETFLSMFNQTITRTSTPTNRIRFQEGDDEACRGNPAFQYPTHVKNGKLKEKRYKCKKCPSAFEKRDQYKVHVGLHGSRQRYQCTVCDYAVTFYANYIQHLKKHRSQPGVPAELLVSLPISKRGVSQLAPPIRMPQQTRIHQPASMTPMRKLAVYNCEHCDYETRQKHLMDDHKRVMHPDDDGDAEEADDYSHSSVETYSGDEQIDNDNEDIGEIGVETEMYEQDDEVSENEEEVEGSQNYEDQEDELMDDEDGNQELEEENDEPEDGEGEAEEGDVDVAED